MMNTKGLIIATINDMSIDFLEYDRRDDEDLTVEVLHKAIEDGVITIEEIALEFKSNLITNLNLEPGIDGGTFEGGLVNALKDLEGIIDDNLTIEPNDTKTLITPKALMDLGFKECYQPPCFGEAGFLFYNFDMYGMELLSTSLGEEEPIHVIAKDNHSIYDLSKLSNFIAAFKAL